MGMLDRGYRMGMLSALYVFTYHKFNDFIFFCVFDGFLENTDTFVLA